MEFQLNPYEKHPEKVKYLAARVRKNAKLFAFTEQFMMAAKAGSHVLENEYNRITNLYAYRKAESPEPLISIQDIFIKYWDDYKEYCAKKNIAIRKAVIENVERMMKCKDFAYGYLFYECPNCDNFTIQGFSCNSRFCSRCGQKYRKQRTLEIEKLLLSVPHRQFVFSIAEELRYFFLQYRFLLNLLFQSVEYAFDYLLHGNKKSKIHKRKISLVEGRDFAYVSFIHTFGRDLKFNPHIHCLVAEGYVDNKNIFHKYEHFNYETLRKAFMYDLLSKMYHWLKVNATKKDFKEFCSIKYQLIEHYKDGFYCYGPRLQNSGDNKMRTKAIANYIARYVSHPAIAESRIISLNDVKNTITYYYDPHEDDNIEEEINKLGRQYVTEDVFEFISKLIQHIPDKGFHQIRYYGFYSNRTTKKCDNVEPLYWLNHYKEGKANLKWNKSLKLSYNYDPLVCYCGYHMHVNYDLSFFPGTTEEYQDG